MTTNNNNLLDEKIAPATKAAKPGAVSVAAKEAARLDRRIASKRGESENETTTLPGTGSAFDQVAATKNIPVSPDKVMMMSNVENAVASDVTTAMIEKKCAEESAVNQMIGNITKDDPAVGGDLVKKDDVVASPVMDKEVSTTTKENTAPEPMPALSPVITTADHGVVQEPDVEYGVYEPNEDGLAVAVAVTEEDEDVFIPAAVEYDPDAKPPLHRNRRFRLYGFLAFFALVACAVGATVGIVLSQNNGGSSLEVHPREQLGIRELIERLVGEQKVKAYNSPYAKALDWIIYEDEAEVVPDDSNFVQRFALAYFYFATSVDKPWKTCNPANITLGETDVCNFQKLASLAPVLYVSEPGIRWLSPRHECEWKGVRCDDTAQQVRTIALAGHDMSGDFPDGLHLLPFLQSLSFPANELRGTFPSEIGTLRHLTNIEFHYNKMSGTIPDEIFNVQNLVRFNLGNNRFTGPISTKVSRLRDLKGLFFNDNAFTGTIPTEVGVLQSMAYLRLSGNQLTGTIPTEIHQLKAIEELWLSDNDFYGEFDPEYANMPNLNDIRMRRIPMLGGRFPDEIWSNLKGLQWVDIRGTNITGQFTPSMGQLSNLLYLGVARTPFSGTVPAEIVNLENLRVLRMEGTFITGTIPDGVCDRQTHKIFSEVTADCLGENSEVSCTCCHGCCDADGLNCQFRDS